uniref:Activin_recp domain-containing protein n=1 Tax=Caenorhabditis tropicalis TaxID=1561998 RepID=A0A1I7UAI9_9PELO
MMMKILSIFIVLLVLNGLYSSESKDNDEWTNLFDPKTQNITEKTELIIKKIARDRQGRPFQVCGITSESGEIFQRCYQPEYDVLPICITQYDTTSKYIKQQCSSMEKERILAECNADCELSSNKKKTSFRCCCYQPKCNSREKLIFPVSAQLSNNESASWQGLLH